MSTNVWALRFRNNYSQDRQILEDGIEICLRYTVVSHLFLYTSMEPFLLYISKDSFPYLSWSFNQPFFHTFLFSPLLYMESLI